MKPSPRSSDKVMGVTRRRFAAAAAVGAVGLAGSPRWLPAEEPAARPLPTVRWGEHEIPRLLAGHNPIKGMSHQSEALSREMREWFAGDRARGVGLLARCQQVGITAVQWGFRPNETLIPDVLRAHHERGGRMAWIATFYSGPQDRDAAQKELANLLKMVPRPIGVQQLGNTSDALMRQGKMGLSLQNLKRFRDAGLLAGLGSHNHEVIDYAESKGWDLDFYQCCLYTSAFSLDPAKAGKETYEDQARQAMTRTIRQVSKPCIAFKVLAAGRHCGSPATVEAALRYAYEHIKRTDVVLVGMWQKHKDQAAENASAARRILENKA